MTTYEYSRGTRSNAAIPAVGATVKAVVYAAFLLIALVPRTNAARGLHHTQPWVLILGAALVSLFLVACFPAALARFDAISVSPQGLEIRFLWRRQMFPWDQISEFQIATIPSARGLQATNQTILRVLSAGKYRKFYDDLSGFHSLLADLDRESQKHGIPRFKTEGVRRWNKMPVDSLIDSL